MWSGGAAGPESDVKLNSSACGNIAGCVEVLDNSFSVKGVLGTFIWILAVTGCEDFRD